MQSDNEILNKICKSCNNKNRLTFCQIAPCKIAKIPLQNSKDISIRKTLCKRFLQTPNDDIMNLKRLRRVLRSLWFFHFHINLKYTEPRHGGERDCWPRLSPAGAPLPAVDAPPPRMRAAPWHHGRVRTVVPCGGCASWRLCLAAVVVHRQWAAGDGALAGDNRGQQSLSPPCRSSYT